VRGTIRVVWDGRDSTGEEVASGVYFVRLTAVGQSATQKILVVR
jgi:hypothetical protein